MRGLKVIRREDERSDWMGLLNSSFIGVPAFGTSEARARS
jgi:hypothetical protein